MASAVHLIFIRNIIIFLNNSDKKIHGNKKKMPFIKDVQLEDFSVFWIWVSPCLTFEYG